MPPRALGRLSARLVDVYRSSSAVRTVVQVGAAAGIGYVATDCLMDSRGNASLVDLAHYVRETHNYLSNNIQSYWNSIPTTGAVFSALGTAVGKGAISYFANRNNEQQGD
ncbi:hypothetical protein ACFLZX_02830 [Nanoarchaeota archaeon]